MLRCSFLVVLNKLSETCKCGPTAVLLRRCLQAFWQISEEVESQPLFNLVNRDSELAVGLAIFVIPVLHPYSILGAKKGLLWYGSDIRYRKPPSLVRDAFSGALGAQNRLLWYGSDIRYRKPPPMVRGAFSGALGAKKGLLWGSSSNFVLK